MNWTKKGYLLEHVGTGMMLFQVSTKAVGVQNHSPANPMGPMVFYAIQPIVGQMLVFAPCTREVQPLAGVIATRVSQSLPTHIGHMRGTGRAVPLPHGGKSTLGAFCQRAEGSAS